MNIDEFESETGLSRRNIRYLVSEGIMPEPDGGRRYAHYGERHLKAARRYAEFKAQGLRFEVIKQRFQETDDDTEIVVDAGPGVRLAVSRDALAECGAEKISKAIAEGLIKAETEMRKENGYED